MVKGKPLQNPFKISTPFLEFEQNAWNIPPEFYLFFRIFFSKLTYRTKRRNMEYSRILPFFRKNIPPQNTKKRNFHKMILKGAILFLRKIFFSQYLYFKIYDFSKNFVY